MLITGTPTRSLSEAYLLALELAVKLARLKPEK
jgi:hypothetical protein